MLLRALKPSATALLLAILLAQAAALDPLFELFCHFSWHLTILALAYAAGFAALRQFRWVALMFGAAAVAAIPLLLLRLDRPWQPKGGRHEEIVLVQFNANFRNANLAGFTAAVLDRQPRPDIVVVQEVSRQVMAQLSPLRTAYRYHLSRPEEAPYGMALFSDLPLERHRMERIPGDRNHYTAVRFTTPSRGTPIDLFELHAIWPLSRRLARWRDYELMFVADLAQKSWGTPSLIVGDLNVTPYSPAFRRLERASGLLSAARVRGTVGTWPGWLPSRLALPIDHLLASHHLAIVEQSAGPSFGSDHRMLTTRLRLHVP